MRLNTGDELAGGSGNLADRLLDRADVAGEHGGIQRARTLKSRTLPESAAVCWVSSWEAPDQLLEALDDLVEHHRGLADLVMPSARQTRA